MDQDEEAYKRACKFCECSVKTIDEVLWIPYRILCAIKPWPHTAHPVLCAAQRIELLATQNAQTLGVTDDT